MVSVRAYRNLGGEGGFAERTPVVHYYIGSGFSIPLFPECFTRPHRIYNWTQQWGCDYFDIYVAWRNDFVDQTPDIVDIYAFLLEGPHIRSMSSHLVTNVNMALRR